MNWIKKHIKEILIVMLLLFSLSKCTQSCNRDSRIHQLEQEKAQYEVWCDSLTRISDIQQIRLDDSQKSNESYIGIATNNQRALINENDSLRKYIKKVDMLNDQLAKENARLVKENAYINKELEKEHKKK